MTLIGIFKEAMRVGCITTKFTSNDSLFNELSDIWEEILLLIRSRELFNSRNCTSTSYCTKVHYCKELDAHFQVFVQRFITHYSLECRWINDSSSKKNESTVCIQEIGSYNVAGDDRTVAVLIIDDITYLSDCDHQECLAMYLGKEKALISNETYHKKEDVTSYGYDVFDTGDGYYLLAHSKDALLSTIDWAQKYSKENECKIGYFTSRYDCTLVEICE